MAQVVKKLPAGVAEDVGLILGSGRSPGGENGKPLKYSSLEGYSPWGIKESDMTEVAERSCMAM